MPPLGGCVFGGIRCSARIPPVSVVGRKEIGEQRHAVFEVETGRGAGAAGTLVRWDQRAGGERGSACFATTNDTRASGRTVMRAIAVNPMMRAMATSTAASTS